MTTSHRSAANKIRSILVTFGALSLDRHALLTIRNLTWGAFWLTQRLLMSVITVKRTVIRKRPNKRPATRRSFRELSRSYFAREKSLEFIIEALLFATMMAISAWPIVAAIDALNQLLQRMPSCLSSDLNARRLIQWASWRTVLSNARFRAP